MKHKVGDKVRVRTWESMEKEFGLDGNGNINMNTPSFITRMKEYCEKVVEIVVVKENFYIVAENSWQWTDQMFEPVDFDWEAFKDKNNKIAVHCKTEEEAKDFCKQMHEHGLEWFSGYSYLECAVWGEYKEKTCYTNDGCFCFIGFYSEINYTILEWSDYMETKKEFTLSDLKDEMIVKMRSRGLYVVMGDRIINVNGHVNKGNYDTNLKCTCNKNFDIVAVYPESREYCNGFVGMLTPNAEPIWVEKKEIVIPDDCKEVLKRINRRFNWIAKDKRGSVKVHADKPSKYGAYWGSEKCDIISGLFNDSFFDWLSWEDKEPVNFREILKGK